MYPRFGRRVVVLEGKRRFLFPFPLSLFRLQRIHALNNLAVNRRRRFVLYWMITARRVRSNFALQRAVDLANELHLPLIVLEALRCDYRWANDRLHTFVLEGMAASAKVAAKSRALYYPYVERRAGDGRGLLQSFSADAAAIVTDWYPGFFIPRMLEAAAQRVESRLEAVDSNGLIPLAAHARAFPTARGYRAFVQRTLREHLQHFPNTEPLAELSHAAAPRDVPPEITARWPAADIKVLRAPKQFISDLPIDHNVGAVEMRGGSGCATVQLNRFITSRLRRYGDDSNHPDHDATSRLSPYLHFGHISAHEVFAAVMTAERWTSRKLSKGARGAREGWWGTSPSAEAFLDQLVVWRELAFNGAHYTPGYGSYPTLPEWARRTLERHQSDCRPFLYDIETLDRAATHDPVWNAAMNQLKRDGWFHGYMRMLWGKKILEWSKTPATALAIMEQLMNRYSLDGRDPVSYASYAWVLGLYDRPWPERDVFGVVRSMTSESAKRKLKLRKYLSTYGPRQAP
jgi:deoxyribodipyrimidine photo-lyase